MLTTSLISIPVVFALVALVLVLRALHQGAQMEVGFMVGFVLATLRFSVVITDRHPTE